MKLKQLFTDDDAVSPVIGVILMVAITVILAAVIGTFVLGLGNQVQSTTPNANFAADFNNNVVGGQATYDNLTITHDGGDKIPSAQLNLSSNVAFNFTDSSGHYYKAYENKSKSFAAMGVGKEVTAGTSVTASNWVNASAGSGNQAVDFDSATFRVIWTSESGDNSATLRKWSGPDE